MAILWIAVLPGLQPSSGLGLCRSTASHCLHNVVGTRHAGRFFARAAFFARGGGGVARAADRLDRAGTGGAAVRDGAGVRVRDGGADLSGAGFAPHDECVRIAVLDGRGAGGPENLPGGEPKAVAAVWRDLRRWPAEQTFHVVLRIRIVPGAGVDETAQAVFFAMDLAGRADRAVDFPAEPGVGGAAAFPHD